MVRVKISEDGLWFTKSHKGEQVNHLFRLGTTTLDGIKIYEIIVWKLLIQWACTK